jgi:hypothetical protein
MTNDIESKLKDLQEKIFNFKENQWNWEGFPEFEQLYDFLNQNIEKFLKP